MENTEKICCRCGDKKSLSEFGKDKYNPDGLRYACKMCIRDKDKLWRDENKDVVKAINLKKKDKRKEYYDSEVGINSSRRAHLKRNFNITLEYYNELSEKQNHVCAICKQKEIYYRNKVLCVDHNHETGEIRGLLCNTCNRALGLLKDNSEFLQSAIEYLNKNRKL